MIFRMMNSECHVLLYCSLANILGNAMSHAEVMDTNGNTIHADDIPEQKRSSLMVCVTSEILPVLFQNMVQCEGVNSRQKKDADNARHDIRSTLNDMDVARRFLDEMAEAINEGGLNAGINGGFMLTVKYTVCHDEDINEGEPNTVTVPLVFIDTFEFGADGEPIIKKSMLRSEPEFVSIPVLKKSSISVRHIVAAASIEKEGNQ